MDYGEPRVDFEHLDDEIRAVWQDMRALAQERLDEYYQSIEGNSVAEQVFTRQTLGELRGILHRHPNQTIPIDLDVIEESLPPQEQLRRVVMRELDSSEYLLAHPDDEQLEPYEITSTLIFLLEQFDDFGIPSDEAAEKARALVVPEPFVVVDQGDVAIDRERTAFFEAVLQLLPLNEQERVRDCQIVSAELAQLLEQRESNDRITVLIIHDRVAASVLERRTEFNNTEVLFASYVTPGQIDELLERRRIIGE